MCAFVRRCWGVLDGLFTRILVPSKEKGVTAEQRGLFKNLFAKPTNTVDLRASAGGKGESPKPGNSEEVTDLDDFLNG